MLVLINYANYRFKVCQRLNTRTAYEVGKIDRVISYSPKDIDATFFELHKNILKQRRGNGYWLWKPYFILKTLEQLTEDDTLMYSDSAAYFSSDARPLYDMLERTEHKLLCFEMDHLREECWTKRDAFIITGTDSTEYVQSDQRMASFSLWKKTPFTLAFLKEWLFYACDERAVTDVPNKLGENYPAFIDHRHDQSLFSLLTKKHGIVSYYDTPFYCHTSRVSLLSLLTNRAIVPQNNIRTKHAAQNQNAHVLSLPFETIILHHYRTNYVYDKRYVMYSLLQRPIIFISRAINFKRIAVLLLQREKSGNIIIVVLFRTILYFWKNN